MASALMDARIAMVIAWSAYDALWCDLADTVADVPLDDQTALTAAFTVLCVAGVRFATAPARTPGELRLKLAHLHECIERGPTPWYEPLVMTLMRDLKRLGGVR